MEEETYHFPAKEPGRLFTAVDLGKAEGDGDMTVRTVWKASADGTLTLVSSEIIPKETHNETE